MKVYQVTQKAHENSIVAELNASVLTSTFKDKTGVKKADLYTAQYKGSTYSKSQPNQIVAHNTCAPIHYKLVETILIDFNDPLTL